MLVKRDRPVGHFKEPIGGLLVDLIECLQVSFREPTMIETGTSKPPKIPSKKGNDDCLS